MLVDAIDCFGDSTGRAVVYYSGGDPSGIVLPINIYGTMERQIVLLSIYTRVIVLLLLLMVEVVKL